jgi:Protein of unknown function (DUF2971)
MAEVQAPIVPSRLYRYRSLTRSSTAIAEEIASIKHQYLYCANFERMNDPMEGYYRPSQLLKGEKDYKDIVKQITDSKSGIGIACFSETYENALMWSHYAGNYTGVCFGYASQNLLSGLPKDASLVRLAYVDKPPLIYPGHARDSGNAARRILSQKQYSWSYEREWRVLGTVGEVSYRPKKALREIFFGSRVNRNHRDLLLSTIRRKAVKAYLMEVDGYGFDWEEVKSR